MDAQISESNGELVEKALNLPDFAQQNQMTEDQVWDLIEEGSLAARFVNNEILVIDGGRSFSEADIPKNELESIRSVGMKQEFENSEDLRDFLLFSQDLLARTMELSQQVLTTKDELIRLKEEKILELQTQLQACVAETRYLKKKVEDLETLCRIQVRSPV